MSMHESKKIETEERNWGNHIIMALTNVLTLIGVKAAWTAISPFPRILAAEYKLRGSDFE